MENQVTTPEAVVEEVLNTPTQPEVEAQTTETLLPAVETPVSWRDSLPEEIRGNKQLSKFDTLEKLAEGYINASALIGKRMDTVDINTLKTVFSPEEFADFAKAKGIPTSVDDYSFDDIIPEADRANEVVTDTLNTFKQMAHEMNLPADQAAKLIKFQIEASEKSVETFRQNNFATLTNTYGKDLTRADQVATKGARALGGDELVDLLTKTGMSSHPVVFKALLQAGERMSEDSVPFQGDAGSSLPGGVADSARQGLANLMKDPVFLRQYKEQRPEAMAQINALYSRFQS